MKTQTMRNLVAALLAAIASIASAHDFQCEKRACVVPVDGMGQPLLDPTGAPSCAAPATGALTIDTYPAFVAFEIQLHNVGAATSVVTGAADDLVEALGTVATHLGDLIEPGFALSVGESGREFFLVPVTSQAECVALFGRGRIDGDACSGVIENRFVVTHDIGSAECRARIVCGVPRCDPLTEVEKNGHCYYLDGSGGTCDPGYALASQSVLTRGMFGGKTYKHRVSDDCCIYNADPVENWGMPESCNAPGPFKPDEPAPGAVLCSGVAIKDPHQLTLCGN